MYGFGQTQKWNSGCRKVRSEFPHFKTEILTTIGAQLAWRRQPCQGSREKKRRWGKKGKKEKRDREERKEGKEREEGGKEREIVHKAESLVRNVKTGRKKTTY